MSLKTDITVRFAGAGEPGLLYLPDLTLWYDWHRRQGTLPERWRGLSLAQVAQAMGVPAWVPVRPWRVEFPGVRVSVAETEAERTMRIETSAGLLEARWSLGPDGDWWQTEYPVKRAEDLPAALEWVRGRSYILAADDLARQQALVADAGVVPIELPRRPYSDLLHDLLGWGDGLALLAEEPDAIAQIVAVLEARLQPLVEQVVHLPGEIVLSPDNLDGQYISPSAYREHLAESYRATADLLHARGKRLVVHVGGPIRRILALLAAAGIDAIEGISGPPQGDTPLPQAREAAGPALTLWGGIPQDLLLPAHDRRQFEAGLAEAARVAREDGRIILGVADRVPVQAAPERIEALQGFIAADQ